MTMHASNASTIPPSSARRANKPFLSGATLAQLQRLVDAPAASLALLATINDCMIPGELPHPILARRANAVDAWQHWTAYRKTKTAQPVTGADMDSLERSFGRAVQAFEGALLDDPVWRFPYVKKPHNLSYNVTVLTAPLMFWLRPHVLIEMTPPLECLLDRSDLGDDLPLDQLRPPSPACFIRFGEAAQRAIVPPHSGTATCTVDGAYVFEARKDGQRIVTVVGVGTSGPHLAISATELVIDDERRTINELVTSTCASETGPVSPEYHRTLVQMCMKVFMYWNSDQSLRRDSQPYTEAVRRLQKLGPKKAARVGRHADAVFDRVILGPLELPTGNGGAGGEKQTHWRRGHFRMQAHGPQLSLRKVIFIAPVLVRADRQMEM